MENKKVAYIGIDPGKSGFIAIISEEFGEEFYPMPTHKVETGKKLKSGKPQMATQFHEEGLMILAQDLKAKFIHHKIVAAIEEVHGRQGWSAQNNFNFGYVMGLQISLLYMINAFVLKVRPQRWQSTMWRGHEIVKVPSSTGKTMVNDSKATSLGVVMNDYPCIDWRKSEKARTPDDNKIDAFLIAKFLYKKLND